MKKYKHKELGFYAVETNENDMFPFIMYNSKGQRYGNFSEDDLKSFGFELEEEKDVYELASDFIIRNYTDLEPNKANIKLLITDLKAYFPQPTETVIDMDEYRERLKKNFNLEDSLKKGSTVFLCLHNDFLKHKGFKIINE